MTMLNARDPLEQVAYSSRNRDTVATGAAAAYLATFNRFFRRGPMMLAADETGSATTITACRKHSSVVGCLSFF